MPCREADLCYLSLTAAIEEVTQMRKKGHICREMGKVFKVGFLFFHCLGTPNKYVMTSWTKCRKHVLQLRASPGQKHKLGEVHP